MSPDDGDFTRGSVLLNKAAAFAIKIHAGQYRKDNTTPYCVHPLRVANLQASHGGCTLDCLCGLWHDILEDHPHKREDLVKELASYDLHPHLQVGIMNTLESVSKPHVDTRAARNAAFLAQIVRGGEQAIFVKLCDRIDNVMDSPGLGDFAHQYVVEETGFLISEIQKLQLNRYCNRALNTLITVRDTEILREGW